MKGGKLKCELGIRGRGSRVSWTVLGLNPAKDLCNGTFLSSPSFIKISLLKNPNVLYAILTARMAQLNKEYVDRLK